MKIYDENQSCPQGLVSENKTSVCAFKGDQEQKLSILNERKKDRKFPRFNRKQRQMIQKARTCFSPQYVIFHHLMLNFYRVCGSQLSVLQLQSVQLTCLKGREIEKKSFLKNSYFYVFFFCVSCLTVFDHKPCAVQCSSLTRMHAIEYTQKNFV